MRRGRLRCGCAALLLPGLLAFPALAAAGTDAGSAYDAAAVEVMEFSQHMLFIPADVSMFTHGQALPAGNYRADVTLNQEWKGRLNLRFELPSPGARVAQPCFDRHLLDLLGFDLALLPEKTRAALDNGDTLCRPLGELFQGVFEYAVPDENQKDNQGYVIDLQRMDALCVAPDAA